MGGRRVGGRETPSEGSEGNDKVAAVLPGTQSQGGIRLCETQRSARRNGALAQRCCVGPPANLLVETGDAARQRGPGVAAGDVARRGRTAAPPLARAVDGLDEGVGQREDV